MYLELLLEKQNMSVLALAKRAVIPYTTMLNLVRGDRALEKASAGTVYRIANALGVTMEELVVHALEDQERKEKEEKKQKRD